MQIAVFGTGMVGKAIGTKLVQLGHEVVMGSRTADNARAAAWALDQGPRARHGTYAEAAGFGALIFNCTSGAGSLEALQLAGEANLDGKVLIDVANPLDFSKGMPPSLFVSNTDSLAEQLQRAFPKVRVVKSLNTVNAEVMVDPARVHGGDHDMFLCGNDPEAKAVVHGVLREWFGWKSVIDLGDLTAARALESYLHLWLRLWGTQKTADFNVKVVR